MSEFFSPRAECSNVPTGVDAIPVDSMLPSLSSLFPGWPANSIPDAPKSIKEAKPENSSPPMQASGGGKGALIAVVTGGTGAGPATFKLIQVFSDGSYSPVGDDVAGTILGKY